MRIRFTHAIFDTYDPDFHGVQGHAYPNKCCHQAHEYLGSVKQVENDQAGEPVIKKYDVYIHEGIGGANVCIRYGDEGHEYISAGTVLDFLCAAAQRRDWTGTGPWHPSVAALLVAKLDFFCEPKVEPKS